jgi:hypothetical protein
MLRDLKNRDRAGYVPKHSAQFIRDKFWLGFRSHLRIRSNIRRSRVKIS